MNCSDINNLPPVGTRVVFCIDDSPVLAKGLKGCISGYSTRDFRIWIKVTFDKHIILDLILENRIFYCCPSQLSVDFDDKKVSYEEIDELETNPFRFIIV